MASPLAAVARLRRSAALRTTLVFGFAGIGFAVANLILARVLPTLEYAIFALVITFLNVGIPLAPLGADVVVNRREVARDGRLLFRALATSLVTAGLAAWVASRWYDVDPRLLWVILVAVTAGGTNYVAGAHFQSRRQFRISLPLLQGVNFVMVAAALLTWVLGVRDAMLALALVGGSYLIFATIGWTRMLRQPSTGGAGREPFLWTEALSCVGVSGVAILLGQLERLLIPQLLTLEVLATYGVLAAIVGSVFRMLWMGVGYSLLPRLRAAESVRERRRLLRSELRTVGAVVVVASIGLWVATPWLVETLLAGKYLLPGALILAALVNGIFKVGSAFARAAATALGDNREIGYLNALGWIAVALAVAGAAVGARWGLPGVLYGVSLGWLSQGAFATWIAAPHFRRPPRSSPGAPDAGEPPPAASPRSHPSYTRST
jgi:O-antigen/teichoic acid export membrane protein